MSNILSFFYPGYTFSFYGSYVDNNGYITKALTNYYNNNLYTINNEEEFKHLYLKLGDIGILENVSKSSYYRGSELVLLGLQIFYKLGIKKCSLVDTSFFVCDRKMNFFSNKEKLIIDF